MTREAFIKVLEYRSYSYEMTGNSVVVTHGDTTHGDDVFLGLTTLETLPPDVQFRNKGSVKLNSLKTLPTGVQFNNGGNVHLNSLETLHSDVQFNNGGGVDLISLKTLLFDVQFMNKDWVILESLENIPSGVKFNNEGDVELRSLIGERFFSKWKGNIEGIDSKRLLNVMISKGVFER